MALEPYELLTAKFTYAFKRMMVDAHPVSIGMMYTQTDPGLLNRNSRYKSVASQFPHNALWISIPYVYGKNPHPTVAIATIIFIIITNSMAYGTWRFNAEFTRALQ